MDITFLQDYIAPIIVGICLCVGFIIKQWVKDVDNRFNNIMINAIYDDSTETIVFAKGVIKNE